MGGALQHYRDMAGLSGKHGFGHFGERSSFRRRGAGDSRLPPEMMRDRDPDTGGRFPTVMAMRERKLRDWVEGAGRLPFTHHVACRDFLLDSKWARAPGAEN
jgi:hypothetical protein